MYFSRAYHNPFISHSKGIGVISTLYFLVFCGCVVHLRAYESTNTVPSTFNIDYKNSRVYTTDNQPTPDSTAPSNIDPSSKVSSLSDTTYQTLKNESIAGTISSTTIKQNHSEAEVMPESYPTLSPVLLHDVYTTIFRLRDGSTLSSVDSTAIDAMRGNIRRILAMEDEGDNFLQLARSLPDDRLLGLLMLAVAGNFTVDQSPSALPQRCGIVVDPGTGVLMLRDNSVTQSVILEVLLIVSIVCLLRSWGGSSGKNTTEKTA